jgi:hypothetical protein
MPTSKKRRDRNDSNNHWSKKLKQQPIASFFGQITIKKTEKIVICKSEDAKTNDLELIDKQKTVKTHEEVMEQEEAKTEFFETSIYTNEFNAMLDTALEGERYLFNQGELDLFDTYKTIDGTCL